MSQSKNGIVLDQSNAKVYKPKAGAVKTAILCDEPASFMKPTWGEGSEQNFDGPFMLVYIPRSNAKPIEGQVPYDCYGAKTSVFLSEHDKVGPNQYVKKVRVLAIRLTKETPVLTVLDGKLEASTNAPAGNWLVQQPKGEQQSIDPDQFDSLYELA